MKRKLLIILLTLVMALVACEQEVTEEDLFAVSNEPGVVTVFKSPT
jgi:ABC-type uncharacterized transport system auxiliary subunit